jgi:hypothetical protein
MVFYLILPAAAVVVLLVCWWLPKWQASDAGVKGKDRLELENELRKTAAQIIGGAAVLAGLYFTFEQLQIVQKGQTTERFTRAVEQVGSQQAEVRVGGIYALGEISKEPLYDRHWVVMSILTAFVRDKAIWRGGPALPTLPEDVQAALSVIGTRDERSIVSDAERHHALDLSGTDLRRALLGRANLRQVQLSRAHLEGADLRNADLEEAVLVGAHLEDTILEGSNLYGADLRGAQLRGASLSRANFAHAHFEGVDLTSVIGLSSEQVRSIIKDSETIIPAGLGATGENVKQN